MDHVSLKIAETQRARLSIYLILLLIFGLFGIHKLYVNKIVSFLLYLFIFFLTAGIINIFLVLLDLITSPITVRNYNIKLFKKFGINK